MRQDRVDRALADRAALDIDAAHARLRGERDEVGAKRRHLAPAQPVFLLGQHDDRATLGRLVRERGELSRIGELALAHAGHGQELGCLAVAERDRAGLVEQQRVDVAGRLDRAARHGEHVEADETVHPGDADRGKQRADRRRDEGDEQRHQHQHRDGPARVAREAGDRHHRQQEDDRHADQQDGERDLVRRLLPLRRPRRARSCGRGTSSPGPR